MKPDFSAARWLHPPRECRATPDVVEIVTEPATDLWQRTYYGFRRSNAPALLLESRDNFTFTTRVTFDYRAPYDQCGLLVYVDDETWCKVSIEHENEDFARLGSVVTNLGYSDWATVDVAPASSAWYRLSRRGPDFLVEHAADGEAFTQMRIFHLHGLGDTTQEMGRTDPPAPAVVPVRWGLYACSPGRSSFTARFDRFGLEDCLWRAHGS